MLHELAGSIVPLQFIWSAADCLAQPSIAARAEQCTAVRLNAQIYIIPNAAHWVQYEVSHAVDELLIAFHKRPSP